MATEDVSLMFAGGVAAESKRRARTEPDSVGVSKVAKLEELRARLSPVRSSQSVPVSPAPLVLSSHVQGSSPSLPPSSLIPPLPSSVDVEFSSLAASALVQVVSSLEAAVDHPHSSSPRFSSLDSLRDVVASFEVESHMRCL